MVRGGVTWLDSLAAGVPGGMCGEGVVRGGVTWLDSLTAGVPGGVCG